ncbi:acetylcholine receptor subunit alpha-1-A-like [Babylonia areolata]|uniref:acetylcholine receptor subunit alpha-1-A-like n=1 Tax=Babylonia areolata TaxID=304850 RepID=UPI003FD148F0
MKPALTVLPLLLITDMCLSQSAFNLSKLQNDLMILTPNIRPVKDLTQPTVINISFHLMSIISLDMVSQKLVSNGWMSVAWQNDYMTWDRADYDGIWNINPLVDRMWRPRLTVENTMKELKPIGEEYVVMDLYNSGLVMWFPAERFETFCNVNVTFFPFDIQRCKWRLYSWGHTADEVILQATVPHINMDYYQENGQWNLIDSASWTETRVWDGYRIQKLIYEVTLRRIPTLLILTVLLPIYTLSFVNVFVFTIPSEAGERLSYAITSFLSFGVFMSFIVDLMPSSSHTISILATMMSCQLIFSALSVLFCIMSLRLFHRDPHKHPVPPTLQTLIVGLELLLCLDPPSQPRHAVHSEAETISDGPGDHDGTEVKVSRLQGHLAKCARKRKAKEEAYTKPEDMDWQRVSRSLDTLLFRFFGSLLLLSSVVYLIVMACHYNGVF